MKKQLSIETVHVEICVVRVDGHKMTLATFRQIPEMDFDDAKGYQYLGWVSAQAPWPDGYYNNYCYFEKLEKLNPNGRWLLCTSPEGTLVKVVWPNLKNAPRGKQLYMAT